MSRSTAFFINGGAGRVITSIPAFEKFEQENPDNDFIIVCEGGMDFYKGHPTLHKRAFDVWHKNLFEDYIKDRDCISPEPYRVWEYYNQKASIAQAFDIIINNKGLREVGEPKIFLNKQEIVSGFNVVQEVKAKTGLDKVIVFQPFGRSTQNMGDFVIDPTSRSFHLNDVIEIINRLKKEYAVILMSEFPIALEENDTNKTPVAMPQIPDTRTWASIIEIADHFLGCDSLGQHLAKALGKTATIVTGSTFPINISYPECSKFDIIDVGEGKRTYSPIRTTLEDWQDRVNDEVMELGEQNLNKVVESCKKALGKSEKFKGTYTPMIPQQQACDNPAHNHGQAQPAQILNRTGN